MTRTNHGQRGTILIIAMVVLFALAALVLTLGRTARTEALTAANGRAAAEADAAERGAEQYAMALLANDASQAAPLSMLTDDDFANVPVGRGAFWIIRPTYNDTTVSQFGLLDESSKLNLNTVTLNQLQLLPGMTDDLAADIINWRGTSTTDAADSPSSSAGGSGMDSGSIKSAQFETVDEMLLLPNMTHDLMYGVKASSDAPNVNEDWYTTHGLADYFTVWSMPSATAVDGTTRLNLSDPSAQSGIHDLLTSKNITGDVVLRPGSDIFTMAAQMQLTDTDFASIEDYLLSYDTNAGIIGLVNPNTAPREVLLALGIADTDVDNLISARPNAIASNPNSMGWVADTLGANITGLGKLLTGRGGYFSADIVAASGDGRAFRRVKIVIDTTASPAKIVYRRDTTDRGWPLDPSILTTLRSGGVVQ